MRQVTPWVPRLVAPQPIPVGRKHDGLMQSLLTTPGLRFLWSLDETSGLRVNDHSGNGNHGTYDGVTLLQAGPNPRVPIYAKFDGINDKIAAAAGCGVRGIGAWTWVAVAKVTNTAANKQMWFESVADNATTNRFGVYLSDTEVLGVDVRTGVNGDAKQSLVSGSPITLGDCIFHVMVDIQRTTIAAYRNGLPIAIKADCNWGGATVVADTAPLGGPVAGCLGAANWFPSGMAMIGMWNRILLPNELQNHARVGGFA